MFAAIPVEYAAEALKVRIGYLGRAERIETVSLLDQPAADDGIAGAQLAIQDNNTTGKFLNRFAAEAVRLKDQDDPVPAAMQLADRGISLFIADLRADTLLKVADAGRERGLIVFNAGAIDDRLRQEDCRANDSHNIWFGSGGGDGCLSSAPTNQTNSMPPRCAARLVVSALRSIPRSRILWPGWRRGAHR